MIEKKAAAGKPADDFIRIQDLWGLFVPKWRWFVLSLFVTMFVAVLYLMSTPSIYTRSAAILVKDDSDTAHCDAPGFPWLQNTVSGAVRTSPEYRNKAIAQSISACMARKQILLKAYSDGARNYCNDPFDCIADKLSYKSNIQVLMMIYRLILENVKNTKETLNKITTVIKCTSSDT